MRRTLITFFVCCAVNAWCQDLDPRFIKAIHQVETGGRYGDIRGAHAERGPLQITLNYWKDSGVPGKFEQCADYEYAVRVVRAYLLRYCRKAVETNDFETLARVHNSGPGWAKKRGLTNGYWAKVKRELSKIAG